MRRLAAWGPQLLLPSPAGASGKATDEPKGTTAIACPSSISQAPTSRRDDGCAAKHAGCMAHALATPVCCMLQPKLKVQSIVETTRTYIQCDYENSCCIRALDCSTM